MPHKAEYCTAQISKDGPELKSPVLSNNNRSTGLNANNWLDQREDSEINSAWEQAA
jgi:hypothetical protein